MLRRACVFNLKGVGVAVNLKILEVACLKSGCLKSIVLAVIINLLGCAAALFNIHFLIAYTEETAYNGVKRCLGVDTLNDLVESACCISDVNRLSVLSGSRPVIACRNRLCGSCVYSLGCRCCVYA